MSSSALGADWRLPINAYLPSTAQANDVTKARETLMATCMQNAGFVYDATHDQTMDPERLQANVKDFGVNGNRRRYGVTSVSAARRYGLHLPTAIDSSNGSGQTRQTTDRTWVHGFHNPTKSTLRMLTTCIHTADQRLGSVEPPALVSEIKAESFTRSQQDPQVQKAFTQYAQCMQDRGYQAANPTEAGANLDTDQPAISAAEREVAVASAECTQKHDVTQTWYRAETRIQQELIDEHSVELTAIRKANTTMLKTVAGILSSADQG